MKIVHISSFMNGGAGTAAFRIHEALLKSRVDSTFVSLDHNRGLGNHLQKEIKKGLDNNSFFKVLKDKMDFRLRKHLGIDFNIKRRIENELKRTQTKLDFEIATLPFSEYDILNVSAVKNADIIHLHWIAGMIDYPTFFRNNKKPVVWTLHDMNPFRGIFHYSNDEMKNSKLAGKLNRKMRMLKQRTIKNRKAPMVHVAPSKWLLREVAESSVFKNVQANEILYAIDTSAFALKRNARFRAEHNIPPGNILLLFVAQSVDNYRKGFDLLISALQLLKGLPITLMAIGNKKDLPVEEMDIRFTGSIQCDEQMANHYAHADAFVIPSREDNLPNVMLESLACGTPVISFKVGGMMDHIENFKTGLLAEEMTAASLAATLKIFIENRQRFDRDYIRKYAEDHFNEKLIAEKYIEIYEKLVKP